jgi:H+/Na+-translocating ferredoxin:NAD+ oxidoreductase subunit B
MADVYDALRKRLDEISAGFPETESNVEIRLLKRLFTEEEAEFFLKLSPLLESATDVAKRLQRDAEEIDALMAQMAKKGLLYRQRKGDLVRYAPVPYIVGIYEFQVKAMDAGFARDHEEYFTQVFGRQVQSFRTPLLRTIPINRELVADWPVAPYEDIFEIVDKQEKIAVTDCICRTQTKLIGRECDKPLENCFQFGSHADYYVENGLGRFISKAEAKEILVANEKAGLVMQPFNAQKIGGMCSCCGDCCGMLRSLKMQPKPAQAVRSNYFARVDDDLCTGCETCLERCQMEAIDVVDGMAGINRDRCIGCGLCVTTCPAEAISLIRKPEDQIYEPPQSGVETYIRIMQERGKI